jgi:hypothetical protein
MHAVLSCVLPVFVSNLASGVRRVHVLNFNKVGLTSLIEIRSRNLSNNTDAVANSADIFSHGSENSSHAHGLHASFSGSSILSRDLATGATTAVKFPRVKTTSSPKPMLIEPAKLQKQCKHRAMKQSMKDIAIGRWPQVPRERVPRERSPVLLAIYGPMCSGKSVWTWHIAKRIAEQYGISPESVVDVSRDNIFNAAHSQLLGGLVRNTREDKLQVRKHMRICRAHANALMFELTSLAAHEGRNMYVEWSSYELEKMKLTTPRPFNCLFERLPPSGYLSEDMESPENHTEVFGQHIILFALNVAFDMQSIALAELERSQGSGSAIPHELLHKQNPLTFQYNFIRYALAVIHKTAGKARRFAISRRCTVKEKFKWIDVTKPLEDLAAKVNDHIIPGASDDYFPYDEKAIDKMMNQWAPLKGCFAYNYPRYLTKEDYLTPQKDDYLD